MNHRMLVSMALTVAMVVPLTAQRPADRERIADLVPIEIRPGLNRIPNAEGDGRDAQVFSAWRDNGNAWGYRIFIVTMPERSASGLAETAWSVVGIGAEGSGIERDTIRDTPHTGEDAVVSVRFARAALDGKPATLLITAERRGWITVPDPSPALIRIYVLRNASERGEFVGTTPDVFLPVISFSTTQNYSDADAALQAELNLPLPEEKKN
ncbi:MAG TPA: hypothetical protein VFY29_19960 [Terriglobia bacterium]|nr:hypothetical protein [Terriglobia bacterium]